jgi:hypothetical protein
VNSEHNLTRPDQQLPTYLPTDLPTYLPRYLPTYLGTYLGTYFVRSTRAGRTNRANEVQYLPTDRPGQKDRPTEGPGGLPVLPVTVQEKNIVSDDKYQSSPTHSLRPIKDFFHLRWPSSSTKRPSIPTTTASYRPVHPLFRPYHPIIKTYRSATEHHTRPSLLNHLHIAPDSRTQYLTFNCKHHHCKHHHCHHCHHR